MECEDLPFFVTAISIQQETGSNLAEILENLAHVIRERFKVYGKVRALTSMGRASANLLAIWPGRDGRRHATSSRTPGYIAPLWETEEAGVTIRDALASVMIVDRLLGICRRMAQIRV